MARLVKERGVGLEQYRQIMNKAWAYFKIQHSKGSTRIK